jgi:excisionase family DNA binding protein
MEDLGEERFLTVPEAADLLRVNTGEVHKLIATGELAALRVGTKGPWRIELTVLEDFISEQYELARRSVAFNAGVFAHADNISDF